jgi:hypothetical protein
MKGLKDIGTCGTGCFEQYAVSLLVLHLFSGD